MGLTTDDTDEDGRGEMEEGREQKAEVGGQKSEVCSPVLW